MNSRRLLCVMPFVITDFGQTSPFYVAQLMRTWLTQTLSSANLTGVELSTAKLERSDSGAASCELGEAFHECLGISEYRPQFPAALTQSSNRNPSDCTSN
jgi:hypothetical protein